MLVGVLKRNYLSLKYTHIQINESERSSRGQRGKFAFKFGKRRCDAISYEEPVMTLPARFWIFYNLSFSCFPQVSHLVRGNSYQSKVVQVKGAKWDKRFLNSSQSSNTSTRLLTYSIYSMWVSKVSFSFNNTPRHLLADLLAREARASGAAYSNF